MLNFGLIGKSLIYSFSKKYFEEKFIKEKNLQAKYHNIEIENINEFSQKINKHNFKGLNITIPYKQDIISKLDYLAKSSEKTGVVNTIEFKKNKLIGHNTDIIGFEKSFKPIFENRNNALILGSGASSKTIKFVLDNLNISSKIIGRKKKISYQNINQDMIEKHDIIINTTPLGTYPSLNESPNIPYQYLSKKHLLYDLVYNPQESLFLSEGRKNGARTKNGFEMLIIQAEASWKIWNS